MNEGTQEQYDSFGPTTAEEQAALEERTANVVLAEPTEDQIRQAAELMQAADREQQERAAERERRNEQYRRETEERRTREVGYLKWVAAAARANVGKAIAGMKVNAVWRNGDSVMLELPGEERRAINVSVYETTMYRGNYSALVQVRAEELGHTLDDWGYAHTETIYQVTSCVNCRAIVAIPRDGTAYGPLLQETCKAKKK